MGKQCKQINKSLFTKSLFTKSLFTNIAEDDRVLGNILSRGLTGSVDYFQQQIQTAIKPHMRRIVTDWMLEVREKFTVYIVNISVILLLCKRRLHVCYIGLRCAKGVFFFSE